MKYHIEIERFNGRNGGGCHWAVVGGRGFIAGGCRGSVFDAVAAANTAARLVSRASAFSVVEVVS